MKRADGQINLRFPIDEAARLERFVCAAANAELLEMLRAIVAGRGPDCIYFHARRGEGRSHLLQAMCHLGDSMRRRSQYLPLTQLSSFNPKDLFEGLERVDLLCVDDLEAVAGDAKWETALLHLFNREIDAGGRVAIAARNAPMRSGVTLPDLRSRLGAGVVRAMRSLNDEERGTLFRQRAREYGLQIDERTERFILSRAARSSAQLLESLQHLRELAVDHRRQLTVPFVKEVCGW